MKEKNKGQRITWTLKRELFGAGTLGLLTLDDGYMCRTLEPKKKPSGKPRAIPAGTYKLVWHESPKYKRVIMISRIPDFSLVYFHAGNFIHQTRGCILPGDSFDPEQFAVLNSRKALAPIVARFAYHSSLGNAVYLTITE